MIKRIKTLRMEEKDNIFGCFFQIGFDPNLREQDFVDIANIFNAYIWGEMGICNRLKKLKHNNYGNGLKLALFQFDIKPTSIESQRLKEIEPYRKNEKSIGIPIIVTDENFFSKSEEERYNFLRQSMIEKLNTLAIVIKQEKLDTKMDQLKSDLHKILN